MSGESLQTQRFPVYNGYAPVEGGPAAIPITLDFTVNGSVSFDVIDAVQRGIVDYIQSMWVDNSGNLNALTFLCSQTGQKIIVPANAQGIWPIIAPAGLRITATTTPAGGLKPLVILLNVPMPMTQYGPVSLTVTNVNPAQGTMTDRSGSLAVAGTSQLLAAANGARKLLMIENPATAAGQGIAAAESLFVNATAAATVNGGNSFEILPGGYWPPGNVNVTSTDLFNVNAATVGHKWVAKEM